MALLKTLTFTSAPSSIYSNPKLLRRQKLIQRLEEQLKLAKDSNYSPTSKRWKKAPDGSKALVEVHRRMKRWWRMDANGNVVLMVRCGFRNLEFEKGKPGIAVGPLDRLGGVLETLIAAAKAGELDALLEAATGIGRDLGPKKQVVKAA